MAIVKGRFEPGDFQKELGLERFEKEYKADDYKIFILSPSDIVNIDDEPQELGELE